MLKSNMKIKGRDTEVILVDEYNGNKSNLRYVNFHDYIDMDRYNEWKWLFNNIRKTGITLEYADELLSKVNTLTKEVESKLSDKVDLRVVDIDESVTPENIDDTLSIMQGIYTRNVNSISESSLDSDIKDKLNNYNVMMSELVNRVKTSLNTSITVNDTELFGFGKKYETCLVSADFSDYIKASNPSKYGLDVNILLHIKHIMNRLSQAGDFFTLSPNSAIKEEIPILTKKIKLLKDGIKVLGAKTEWHKTKVDSDLVDPQKYIKWNKNLLDTQKEQLADYDYYILPDVEDGTTPRSLYMGYRNLIIDAYEEILKIRQLLKTNIREMKVMDREENTTGTYVSRSVKNHKQVYEWFANQGLTPVPSEELHVTISYSRVEFNHTADDKIIIIAPSQMLSIEPLGNEGCLTMKLTSDELKANFDKCMSEGATYDYDEYVPHITIAINVPDEIISTLVMPDFSIELDVEIIKPLDLNWEDKITDKESFDAELFGFGKKYESDLAYTNIKQYLKGGYWIENTFFAFLKRFSPLKDFDISYKSMQGYADILMDNLSIGTAKVRKRIVSPDSEIVDDEKFSKSMSKIEKQYVFNKECIDGYKLKPESIKKLHKLNDTLYHALKKIRTVLKAGIKEVKSNDKESFDDGVVSIVSSPFEYMDTEGFQAISGLVATGFKKVTAVISGITDNMTTTKPDYNDLVKGFFSKDKRYQDVYTYLVPVPAGYNGYIKDVSLYVLNNINHINTLDSNVDNLINTLSTYINSAEYRESFAVDMSTSKAIETIASDLYKENRKYISESKEDSRAINKLLRSANELDDAVDYLKKADKILDLKQLESIKKKMKQVDNLVTVMIDNKNQYSKPKLLEIAKYIDAIISLSNAVGTVIYLKNSTDIILVDIKNIL